MVFQHQITRFAIFLAFWQNFEFFLKESGQNLARTGLENIGHILLAGTEYPVAHWSQQNLPVLNTK